MPAKAAAALGTTTAAIPASLRFRPDDVDFLLKIPRWSNSTVLPRVNYRVPSSLAWLEQDDRSWIASLPPDAHRRPELVAELAWLAEPQFFGRLVGKVEPRAVRRFVRSALDEVGTVQALADARASWTHAAYRGGCLGSATLPLPAIPFTVWDNYPACFPDTLANEPPVEWRVAASLRTLELVVALYHGAGRFPCDLKVSQLCARSHDSPDTAVFVDLGQFAVAEDLAAETDGRTCSPSTVAGRGGYWHRRPGAQRPPCLPKKCLAAAHRAWPNTKWVEDECGADGRCVAYGEATLARAVVLQVLVQLGAPNVTEDDAARVTSLDDVRALLDPSRWRSTTAAASLTTTTTTTAPGRAVEAPRLVVSPGDPPSPFLPAMIALVCFLLLLRLLRR